MWLEGFGFDAGEAVDGDMASQLPTLASQAAGLQTGSLRGIQFLDDVRQKQNLPRLDANCLLDVAIGLFFAFRPRRGVEVTAEQRCQIASEQPKISFCAWIEPDEYTNS